MKEWKWECINSFCVYRLWILLSYLHCCSLQNALGKSPGKALLLYRHIHNPVKNLRFSFLAKKFHPRCFPRFWMRLESSIISSNLYNFMKVYKLFIACSALVYYFLFVLRDISTPAEQWANKGTVDYFHLHNPFSRYSGSFLPTQPIFNHNLRSLATDLMTKKSELSCCKVAIWKNSEGFFRIM